MKPTRATLLAAIVAATLATLATSAVFITQASASEADIRQAMEAGFPGTKVNSVAKSPIPGLNEVVLDGSQVIYTDDKGQYILVGDLIDTKNRRNLTNERKEKLTAVKWDDLPLKNAIKITRGDGKRKVAVFSDPDCPYCKKAEQELIKLDNITVYTFAYPLDMHPDAGRKSKLVWCSKDRGQAWLDLMLKGKMPEGKGDCDNPIDANLELGHKLHVDGTPALILSNGKRIPGYVPADRLEAMLKAIEEGKK